MTTGDNFQARSDHDAVADRHMVIAQHVVLSSVHTADPDIRPVEVYPFPGNRRPVNGRAPRLKATVRATGGTMEETSTPFCAKVTETLGHLGRNFVSMLKR